MKIYLVLFALLLSLTAWAQKPIDKAINASYTNNTLTEIFYKIQDAHGVKIYFDINEAPTFRVTRNFKNKQIWAIVSDLLNGTRLKSLSYSDNSIVVIDLQKINREEIETLVNKWKTGEMDFPKKDGEEEISKLYGNPGTTKGESRYRLTLLDKSQKEPLVGALVFSDDYKINDVTNEKGICTLNLPNGQHILNMTYTSFQPIKLTLEIYENAEETFEMSSSTYILDEVEIVANNARTKMENTKTGVEVIDMAKVEAIPQVLGESDLIKSLEVLPGVTSAGEISSGFNVRGGKLDASLVLMDDAIIFNPTHVVGFISAFNSDFIKSATLYKGYVEPNFGNRSSAVLDVTSNKGGQKWKAKGGLGTSMMKLLVEGPITSKTSFAASARGSFSDYLLNLVANNEVQNSSANFYDWNIAINHKFSDRTSLSFSSYASDDYFLYNQDFGFEWQNKFASLIARHSWNEKFNSKLSLSTGAYTTNQFTINASDAFSYRNGISYLKGLQSNTYNFDENNYLKAGIEYIDYTLDPEELFANEEQSITRDTSVQRLGSISFSPFISGKLQIIENISIEAGARFTSYAAVGPGPSYEYSEGILVDTAIIGASIFNKGERVSTFSLIEPRVSASYLLNSLWSIKASYNKISQNAQLVSIANTSIPTDLWIFSNQYIRPRVVDQFSFGVFHTGAKDTYSLSVEAFTKSTDNDFVLRDFPNIISNDHLETEVSDAIGRSYGIELFAEKTTGKLTGSIAYTFSKTEFRTTTDRFPVNFGEWTPADIDIPHQVNMIFSYRLTPTFIISGGYTFKSGRPFTVPEGTAIIDGFVVPLYTLRNKRRLPSYKRFDISMTLDLRKSTQGGFRSSFTFGLYNAFGNNNVNNVFFRKSVGGNVRGFQLSIIGAVVPSFSWNFVFD
ncbi:MAG: carboxypeptidase-like regulatory domain-containing protein [Bacteroidota bacterium]